MGEDPIRSTENSGGSAAHLPNEASVSSICASKLPPTGDPLGSVPDAKISPQGRWLPSLAAKEQVDFINKCLQIAAISVAAVWALFVFVKTVVPGLEPKLNVTGDISWTPVPGTTDICEAHFALTVKNPGPGSVNVKSAFVRIWVKDLGKVEPSEKEPSAIEREMLTGEEKERCDPDAKGWAYQKDDLKPLLDGIASHYPPGGENNSSQAFLFKKNQNAFTLIEVCLDSEGRSKVPLFTQQFKNYGYAMDRVCGSPVEGKLSPSSAQGKLGDHSPPQQ